MVIHFSSLLFSSDDSLLSLFHTAFAEEQANTTTYDDTNSTSITLNETINVGDNMVGPEDTLQTGNDPMKPTNILSPLKQIKNGVMSEDVICKQDLKLTFRIDGQAACVKITSIEKLITRGWTQ
ncbi:MAG TPA: hypothetical protein VLD64_06780 [Nitrosarchaeum sp.]|nr:hypothetical protein [Nitrosarchaeum sp.]